MGFEKAGYRDNLARIAAAFPEKEMLKKGDVMKLTGMSYYVVNKHFKFKGGYISQSELARQMCVC